MTPTTTSTDDRQRLAPPPAPLPLTSQPAGARATTAPGLRATTLRAARILALLHAGALLVAVTVALIPGAPATARELLQLNLHPPPGTHDDAVRIFLANLAALVPLLLGPPIVAWLGPGRRVLLAYAGWLAGWAVLTVGAALGAYGAPLLTQLAHVPLEWAALALATANIERSIATPHDGPVALASTAGMLLAVAAAVEAAIP